MGPLTMRRRHRRTGLPFTWLAALCLGVPTGATAEVVELARPQLHGSPLYRGAATRIYRFDAAESAPDRAQIVPLLAGTPPGEALHCESLAEPDDREGRLEGETVALRYVRTGNGDLYFDWSAAEPVEFIKVQGEAAAYVYAYPAGRIVSDTGLRTPARKAGQVPRLRRFEFCFRGMPRRSAPAAAQQRHPLPQPESYDCIRMVRTLGLDHGHCRIATAYAAAAPVERRGRRLSLVEIRPPRWHGPFVARDR